MLTLLVAVKQGNVERNPSFVFFLPPGAPSTNLPDFKVASLLDKIPALWTFHRAEE